MSDVPTNERSTWQKTNRPRDGWHIPDDKSGHWSRFRQPGHADVGKAREEPAKYVRGGMLAEAVDLL